MLRVAHATDQDVHAEADMQLLDARLCLDCDEVHDAGTCPICGSESFAYVSRWVPAPPTGRSRRTPNEQIEQAAVYRELLGSGGSTEAPNTQPATRNRRLLKRGLVGLTALGLAGWAWRSSRDDSSKNGS